MNEVELKVPMEYTSKENKLLFMQCIVYAVYCYAMYCLYYVLFILCIIYDIYYLYFALLMLSIFILCIVYAMHENGMYAGEVSIANTIMTMCSQRTFIYNHEFKIDI